MGAIRGKTPGRPGTEERTHMEKISAGKRLYEQVVERVRGMIEEGMYQKGDLLPSEKELTEMMGVSRITVREAMRLLSEAGVIRTVKGKGSFVLLDREDLLGHSGEKAAYPKSFLESTDIRLLLEPAAARHLATHGSEAARRAIGDHLVPVEGVLEGFHLAIIRAIGNQILTDFFESLLKKEVSPPMMSLIPPFRQKSITAKLQSQHEKIYEAIRDGDGEFAYFYMLEHQQFVKDTYQEFFGMFYQ